MSAQTRLYVANHLLYQNETSQRDDLLDDTLTNTTLIALLEYLVKKGYYFEATAIRSDHSDDGSGPGYHASGFAIDGWPCYQMANGTYLPAVGHAMRQFLKDMAEAPYLMQIGLGGSADTDDNRIAAGPTVFGDDYEDHIHLGTVAAE